MLLTPAIICTEVLPPLAAENPRLVICKSPLLKVWVFPVGIVSCAEDNPLSSHTTSSPPLLLIWINEANELIMKKPIITSNLNNFVISTATQQTETRIIPVKLEIDLNSPSLKTKGIKPKKYKKQVEETSLTELLIEKKEWQNPRRTLFMKVIS